MSQTSSDVPVVLVVEDVEEIRSRMKDSLRSYGYEVVEATDADEALLAAERTPPDLIFTEEELPALDDLTERLRRHSDLSQVPIVIINPDEEEGTRYGDIIVLGDYEQLRALLPQAGGGLH